jgi:hypothetical protein
LLAALQKADSEVAGELSLALADLRDFQERYGDAAAIYRRLLELNDRNVVALNNLAWLVSFQPVEKVGRPFKTSRRPSRKSPTPRSGITWRRPR